MEKNLHTIELVKRIVWNTKVPHTLMFMYVVILKKSLLLVLLLLYRVIVWYKDWSFWILWVSRRGLSWYLVLINLWYKLPWAFCVKTLGPGWVFHLHGFETSYFVIIRFKRKHKNFDLTTKQTYCRTIISNYWIVF